MVAATFSGVAALLFSAGFFIFRQFARLAAFIPPSAAAGSSRCFYGSAPRHGLL